MDSQDHVTFLPLWNVDSEMLQHLIVRIENGSLGKEKGEISPLLPPLLCHWIGVIPRETSLYKIIFELVNIYPMLKDFKDSLKPPYPQHRTLTANSEQTVFDGPLINTNYFFGYAFIFLLYNSG